MRHHHHDSIGGVDHIILHHNHDTSRGAKYDYYCSTNDHDYVTVIHNNHNPCDLVDCPYRQHDDDNVGSSSDFVDSGGFMSDPPR